MTAEQIEEKIDDISHYVGYIGEQKVRFFASNNGDVFIPHCYIDELIAVPKSTMRVKICKSEVQSVIGQLKKVESLFNGNQGFYNSLREDQVAPYMLLYSRLNIEDTKNKYIMLMNLVEQAKQELTHKENEPAPAAIGTSSEVSDDTCSILQFDDSTKERICQEAEKAYKACELMLEIYERMDDSEQKAFDLGQSYRAMVEVKKELERIGRGGVPNA